MPALADLQASIARAVMTGRCDPAAMRLVGGREPHRRLAIHRRNYERSLVSALGAKFPATAWLIGEEAFAATARSYVHAHPPRRPCIAEYGGDFPAFLAGEGRPHSLPYLRSFAELEWAVGQVSIAIELPALEWAEVARLGATVLLDAVVTMQPGLRYLRSGWSVDVLMKRYLADQSAEAAAAQESDTCIEVGGARGALRLKRLDAAGFAFRSTLRAGGTISAAAESALESSAAFDAGAALRQVVEERLATAVRAPASVQ